MLRFLRIKIKSRKVNKCKNQYTFILCYRNGISCMILYLDIKIENNIELNYEGTNE